MTADELARLLRPEVRQAVAASVGRDPLQVALDARVPEARLVATQVKYLGRARRKLPSSAAAQCLLPPRAFEQASSEACAACKRLSGGRVLDLTCGLGVDAAALSRRFRAVVTLERDPVLAAVAEENFRRLGITNVEVVQASAEEYLQRGGLAFDWIYADPDRRDAEGRRRVRMEDCSPDVVALLPLLRRVAPRLCIKSSPLFDIDEAPRLFGPCGVEVLSAGDECKEVVIYVDPDDAGRCGVTATAVGAGSFTAPMGRAAPEPPGTFDSDRYRWLVLTDVALRKARIARLHLFGRADMWSETGFGFAAGRFADPLVRLLPIERIEPYDPRRLKRELKGAGAEILKREFPLGPEEVMRRTGLHAGCDVRLAFTRIGGAYWTIRIGGGEPDERNNKTVE